MTVAYRLAERSVLSNIMNDHWRERLRQAVDQSGQKHSAIAWKAGVAPETLSRIINDSQARPGFDTIVRIVHASGETVGRLLR